MPAAVPFAILALPIAHRWAPEAVRFTLIDYHARSVEAARRVAEYLGVADRVHGVVQADAATYRCPPEARPHVLVTETMQRGLEKEPQVSITRNLARQLRPGGTLVPERIALHLTLLNPGKEFGLGTSELSRDRQDLGCVMELDRAGDRCCEIVWPDRPRDGLEPFIRTSIRVFEDIMIDDYESGLTVPIPLGSPLDRQTGRPQPGQRLRFEYRLDPSPHLTYAVT